eukprot:TRINITY_DN6578_c0_g1_i1.p1 TRINITY_DN6578_c0_g1~~TRINITY_DN6578_c0_g1_i1.p1  ORF type:complete len:180 (-),score=23.26 TRINITY_DN6578_c0_g1_i1:25-564(-)
MLQAPLYRPRAFTDPFGEPPDKIQNESSNAPTIRFKDHSPNYSAGRQPHPVPTYASFGGISSSNSTSSISSTASNSSVTSTNTTSSATPSTTTSHSKDYKDSKDSSQAPPVGATAGLVITATGTSGSGSAFDQAKNSLRDCISKKSSTTKILSVLKQLTYYPPITSASPLIISTSRTLR